MRYPMKRTVWEASAARCTAMPVSPGWLVVLAAFFGVMVSFGSLLVFTFGTFLKPLSAEFGWSRQAISMAFGCAAITVAICSPALGHLLDRYGPRRVILPCMAIFGTAIASLGLLTPNLFHLYGMKKSLPIPTFRPIKTPFTTGLPAVPCTVVTPEVMFNGSGE